VIYHRLRSNKAQPSDLRGSFNCYKGYS